MIGIIYTKEMKEILRDRKSVLVAAALPILFFPIILSTVMMLFGKQENGESVVSLAIVHPESLPGLSAAFAEHEGFEIAEGPWLSEDLAPAIKAGKIEVGLVFRERTAEPATGYGQQQVDFHYQNGTESVAAEQRMRQVVDAYVATLRAARFSDLGLDDADRQALTQPLQLNGVGIAGERGLMGALMGGFFPVMLVIFCFNGARFTAVDLAAGEKERGTLETLLLTPVHRGALVMGKLLAVFSTSIVSAWLCLASLGVWIGVAGTAATGEIGTVVRAIGAGDLILIALILVPLATVLSAVLLCLSVYAESHKQAQTLIEPVNQLLIPLLVVALVPGVSLNGLWAMVPVTNIALVIKDILGGTVDYGLSALIFVVSSVIAMLAVRYCSYWFQREEVLFRS